ncbi:DUF445 domain-containing protein [uncultured Megasphaera sp.]|uniref:DUF445 domain-containing protein n=1 Tax=uncultured Megasphaera sp. TaxID=165188 RepID=UPI0025F54938|nr:DUF445 family protein [uncultured Megasphaera sp.]
MTYRQRANLILGLSFVCFIAIFFWWYTHDVSVWEELLFFVIQSALIGSIADWFAVTALFEKPLGFPYHTELLYRHRDRIIDGIARLISEKLLQPDMWKDKLYQISFIDKVVDWLRGDQGREKLRTGLYEVALRAHQHIQRGETQSAMAYHLRMYLKRQPLVSFFEDRIISLLEDPKNPMFHDLIGLVREVVNSEDFDAFLERLIVQWCEESQHSSMSSITLTKVLSIVDTKRIAKDIKLGIVNWLDQWEHAEGEQREWLCRKLEILLYSMNGQLSFAVQNWQNEFVDALPIEQWLADLENSTKDYFMTGEKGREELKDLLEEQFIHYLEYCRSYPEIKDWLDEQIRRAFNVILEHEHALIAVAVRDVLSGFDKKRFNQFLESKVGEDLAWIRINGAIVGASIGLCVFGVLKIYQFTLVPFLRGLFL